MDVPISTSTTVATRDEPVQRHEQLALAGFLAGYSGLTRDAYTLDLRQYVALVYRASAGGIRGRVAPTSSASPATSSHWAGPGPRSRDGCAPCPVSTATPNRAS